jgi:hypothetical protein
MQSDDNLLNPENLMTLYKGYECYRNRITKRFYAVLICSDMFLGKITADTPAALKQAIDEATEGQEKRLDPWQLPYSTAETSIAA